MLRAGLVGLGRMGRTHAEHLAKYIKNTELVAVCALDDEQLEEAKQNLGVEQTYKNFEEMIDNANLDYVVIASPTGFHPEMVKYSLSKGVHTFSEKPLGLKVEDIEELLKVVEQYKDLKFTVGFMRRFDASYKNAKEMIEKGQIGDITLVRAYGIDPSAVFDTFVNFAANNDSGGIYHDMSIHDIDLIRWLTGSEFKRVWAIGANKARPELDDLNELETAMAQLEMDNKIMVNLVAGRNAPHGNAVEMEIMGTKGWLRIAATPEKNLVTILDEHGVRRECSMSFQERFDKAFIDEKNAFVDCILNDEEPKVNGYDALMATKVSLICQKSYEEGKLLDI